MSETMVPVTGGELWSSDSGGGKPPLVLLHPGVGDARIWDPILPALVADHRVIRFEARGYGRSPAPAAPYTMLDDLVTVLDFHRVGTAALVGCSMGGETAAALAVTRPERVSALVLLCPGMSGYPWPDEPEMQPEFEAAEAAGLDGVAALIGKIWGAAGPAPAVTEQIRSAARAWLFNEDFEQDNPPVYDRLHEIAVPTSLLVGDLDKPALVECNRRIVERIPDCEFVEVPGVDHFPPLRVPEMVLGLIRRTLARVGASE